MNTAQPRPRPGGFWFGTALLLLLAGARPALAVVAESIAAGAEKTFAVTTTGGVKGWGVDQSGDLGVGGDVNIGDVAHSLPTDLVGLSSGVQMVATSHALTTTHSCAVMVGGALKCWGANGAGQLGDGTMDPSNAAVDVVGLASGVTSVAVGRNHTCALLDNGAVQCWGDDVVGQLGDGMVGGNLVSPTDVIGLGGAVQAIAAGGETTCALTSTGGVKCWGELAEGDSVTQTFTAFSTPVDVPGLTSGVVDIAVGAEHVCALTDVGAVKCWGRNARGEVGNGTTTAQFGPVDVSGLSGGVEAIAAGGSQSLDGYTCALMDSGNVKCWGTNNAGQLGDGTYANRLAPVDVVGLSGGVKEIAAGVNHTCALTSAESLTCWGNNDFGQLGNGTTIGAKTASSAGVIGLSGVVTTIAGNGLFGACCVAPAPGDGGSALDAPIYYPVGLAVGTTGTVYVGELQGHRIREISPSGIITTFAGTGDPGTPDDNVPATESGIYFPAKLLVDGIGDVLVADTGHGRVRRIDGTGTITTVAGAGVNGESGPDGDGGSALDVYFDHMGSIALDSNGTLYVAENGGDRHRIRRVDSSGVISLFAGTGAFGYSGDGGPATQAKLSTVGDMTFAPGGTLYFVDGCRIRAVDPAGIIDTVAGNGKCDDAAPDGTGLLAMKMSPRALLFDDSGRLLVGDSVRIRRIDFTDDSIVTIAGSGNGFAAIDGPVQQADFGYLGQLALDLAENLYVTDTSFLRVRMVTRNCGNGVLDQRESCDDGNSLSGDGCGVSCTVQPGFDCPGEPSVCMPANEDTDGDGVLNALDLCTNVGDAQTLLTAKAPKLTFRNIGPNSTPGTSGVTFRGAFRLPGSLSFTSLDLGSSGAHIVVQSGDRTNTRLDALLPPGPYLGRGSRGWKQKKRRWLYLDRTNDPIGGITKVLVADGGARAANVVKVKFKGRGTYPIAPADSPLYAAITFGGSAAAVSGACTESAFTSTDCAFNGRGNTVTCSSR